MILDEIVAVKHREVTGAKQRLPLEELQRRVHGHRAQRHFFEALRDSPHRPALVAELKRKSPSRGMLRERFDPVSLAQQLQEAGASALSVLTDEQFFGGALEFLRDVQQFTELPVLRKDVIVDPYQIYEAAYQLADAVLLIVQVLPAAQLREALRLAETLGMEALVEVHAEDELETAVRIGARVIGINQRDLRTFTLQADTAARLVPKIPAGTLIVAESGIQTSDDVRRLRDLGVRAVLVGEALMTSPDVAAKVHELFRGIW